MIPGTVIILGAKRYVMPPVNVATMQLHEDFFKAAAKGEISEDNAIARLGTIADIVFRSLRRNYPEVTLEEVSENVDFGNMEALMQSVFKTSGFVTTTEAAGE